MAELRAVRAGGRAVTPRVTPRDRALRISLKWYCMGECAGDAVLCQWHRAIQAEIEAAVGEAVVEILGGVPSPPRA